MAAPNIVTTDMTIEGLYAAGCAKYSIPFYVNLATLSDAVQLVWTPGHKGRLIKVSFTVHIPVTTGSKLSTLTPSIGGTNVTGGVLALTSALATPRGAQIDATAITALNAFSATQSITITGSSTTAFVEGSGWLLLTVVNDDTLKAVANMGGLFSSAS